MKIVEPYNDSLIEVIEVVGLFIDGLILSLIGGERELINDLSHHVGRY